jgi:dihydrofolate reductase
MSHTITSISMSLDGYMAGNDICSNLPMGKGGSRLHNWIFESKVERDSFIMSEIHDSTGAVIIGGHTYKTAINEAWGGESPFSVPAFVITHDTDLEPVEGFEFVNDGIEEALEKAKVEAAEKDVWIMGGANIIQQYINKGLLDFIQINLINVLMGKGLRLFDNLDIDITELKLVRDLESIGVTHLKYQILK